MYGPRALREPNRQPRMHSLGIALRLFQSIYGSKFSSLNGPGSEILADSTFVTDVMIDKNLFGRRLIMLI